MKDFKILKSALKGRKKVVEGLVIAFMITGSLTSFAGDYIGTPGETITITSDLNGDIFGDFKTTDLNLGSDNHISIENSSINTSDGSSPTGNIFGDNTSGNLGDGGNDVIKLTDSFAGFVYGDRAAGTISTGGVNEITLTNSNVYRVYGSFSKGALDKGGVDTITIDSSTVIQEVYGDYSKDDVTTGGDDFFIIKNNSVVDDVVGDYSGASDTLDGYIKTGGNDVFELTSSKSLGSFYGDYSKGNIETGGNDTFTLNDGHIDDGDIFGERSLGSITTGGNDSILLENSSSIRSLYGEYSTGNIGTGGDDTITVIDSSVSACIYGESLEGTLTQGGNDTITIENSTIGGDIFGESAQEYATNTHSNGIVISGGDDIFTLIGATTIGGKVSGGEDKNGIILGRDSKDGVGVGDYDILNLSAYTTDFTTLNYEGIEEVNLVDSTAIDLGDGPYTSNKSVVFNVENGSSIKADNGEYTMDTSLSNTGTIDLVGDSGHLMGDKLTINGDFTGDGGVIFLDMNGMDLISDMIVVKGDFTGTQLINPTMIDTETEFKKRSVDFMEVEGNNNGNIGFMSVTRGRMITKGRVTGSAFEWEIKDMDMTDGSDMWFITTLQSDGGTDSGTGGSTGGGETVVLPELPGYASLQNIGEDMIHSNVDSLYTRLGDIRRYKAENEGESLTKDKVIQDDDYMELSREGVTVWTRATAEYFDYEANGDAYGYDGDVSGFDIGADYTFELSRDTAVVAGLLYGKRYGNFETSTSDEGKYVVAESADIDMDSWSLAAYGTFIYKDNTYLDLVAGYTDYESDIDAPGLNDSVDGDAIWGSAEVGHSFQVGDIWRVEPQVQLTYTEVDFDDTTNDIGTKVEYTSNNQLTGRIGTIVSAGIPINEVAQVRPWFGVSVLQEFMDPEDVTYGGTDFEGQDIDTYMEYKLGVQLDLNEAVGMYVEGKYQTDYDDYDSYRGTLGVKYSF